MRTTAIRDATRRAWFEDARGSGRRLQVTCHSDKRRVVLSIWHHDTCTAAVQVPIDETPGLIAHLADCLSGSVTYDPAEQPRTRASITARLWDRVRAVRAR